MKKLIISVLAALFVIPFMGYAQGCVEADPDEPFKMIGFIQPQYGYDFRGEDIYGNTLDESSFYFNRARFGMTGNIPYDFSYYFMTEFSPTLGGPFVLDAFIQYKRFAPYVNVSFGQFKRPFGIELLTACHKLHTIDRSLVVRNLANNRDFGIMLSGGTGELEFLGMKTENIFGYNLAVMNGVGRLGRDDITFDNNQFKDIIGRLTFHPIEFITLAGSYSYAKHPSSDPTAEEEDTRMRYGFDVELKYKGFLVQGEYIYGEDVGSYTTGGGCGDPVEVHQGSVKRSGYFVQALYMTPWNIQPVVKFETFDPNMDVTVGDTDYDTSTAIQNTVTFGFNYFFNDRVRIQANYLYMAEENYEVEHNNDQLLLQAQIQF